MAQRVQKDFANRLCWESSNRREHALAVVNYSLDLDTSATEVVDVFIDTNELTLRLSESVAHDSRL